MTADSDDTVPQRVDEGELDEEQAEGTDEAEHRESLIDRMRGTGVGVEDPDIVGDPHPGLVDAEIAEDEPPQV
ncbi:MAG TPA: hypothetical protein VFU14_06070 [Acidimicrobiales bacterium]|nr:hypothetical protein [Acidimicrobiales bacterium]